MLLHAWHVDLDISNKKPFLGIKMNTRNFRNMLEARWAEGKFVCVGLDSEYAKIPQSEKMKEGSIPDVVLDFNKAIIDETHDLVCAYKPNKAFYEALGEEGFIVLYETIGYINEVAPGVPVILDCKDGDIGNTNAGYVKSAFERFEADAVTVPPYMGKESLQPFLDQKDKGIIVLCRTSNPGAGEFQDLIARVKRDGETAYEPLFCEVAYQVSRHWNTNNNCCLVVGATTPNELKAVREIVGDLPILVPGIGAQGGDIEKTVKAGKDSRGKGMIINSSRGIIFASSGEDFAEVARNETQKFSDEIQKHL